jgi:predicted protein tyrosine phosphatase
MHLETQIFDDNDNLIQINGYVIRGQQGMKGYYGECTPDDPDEVEIQSAFDHNDNEIELTEEQTEWATEALWDEAQNY